MCKHYLLSVCLGKVSYWYIFILLPYIALINCITNSSFSLIRFYIVVFLLISRRLLFIDC